MNKILKIVLIANLVLIIIAAIGCNEDGSLTSTNPNNNGSTITTTISGTVVNENNQPVFGATVTAYGQTKTTGLSGEFMFTNITVPQNRLFIKAEKQGYYTATKGDEPKTAGTVFKITMLTKSVTHTINSVSGGSADLTNGSKVEIQPGSVVKSDGSSYNGQVNISVEYMDPTDVKFSETVSGGDMMARRTDSTDAVLYSFGILKVEMESPAGEKLNVTGGKPSTITTTIPATMVSEAPATIPLWYFDENTGLWREEGTATKQGDKYVGTVNHFTDWNNDQPGYLTRVTGRIVDCQQRPMAGLVIRVGQTTATTDENGVYSRTVPTGIGFTVQVEASQNFGISGTPINVPALVQNQVYQCPPSTLSCYPVLTGIFKDCSGNNLYGILSMSWDNQVQGIMPTQAGSFRVNVAPNKQAHLKFTSYNGDVIDTVIQTPATVETLNLGDLRSCGGNQGSCENSFVINGAGYSNLYVRLQNAVSIGVYSVQDSVTAVTASATDTTSMTLVFAGKTTGNYSLSSGAITYKSLHFYSGETVNITVTAYGSIGDYIRGTFEGTFESTSGTVTISNGKFCAIRQTDVQ